jgi:hypothetical protein
MISSLIYFSSFHQHFIINHVFLTLLLIMSSFSKFYSKLILLFSLILFVAIKFFVFILYILMKNIRDNSNLEIMKVFNFIIMILKTFPVT